MVEKAVEGKMNGMNRVTAVGMGMSVTGLMMLLVVPAVLPMYMEPYHFKIYVKDSDGVLLANAVVHMEWLRDGELLFSYSKVTNKYGYTGDYLHGKEEGDIFRCYAVYGEKRSSVWEGTFNGSGWEGKSGLDITLIVPLSTPSYTVSTSVEPANSGNVSGGGSYQAGQTVTLRATPNPGYEFDRWEGYLMSKENPKSFEMPSADVEITAYFKKIDIPPETGTLLVNTTPVRGKIYVNGQLWGTAPQSRELSPGTYTITFPDKMKPSLLSDKTGRGARWIKEGNRILWVSGGVPASLSASGKAETYSFRIRTAIDREAHYRAAFILAWRAMRDSFYDGRLNGRDWDAVRTKYVEEAGRAGDPATFGRVVELMLGELNGSHLGFHAFEKEWTPPDAWREETAHLGLRFDPAWPGPGWKVRDVLPGGPADREASRVSPGEVVLEIDGAPRAFWYGHLYKETFFILSTGFDPSLERFHPGTYLLTRMLGEIFDEGPAKALDFGWGDAQYKRSLGETKWTEASMYLFPPTPRGMAFCLLKTATNGAGAAAARVLKELNSWNKVRRAWRKRLAERSGAS